MALYLCSDGGGKDGRPLWLCATTPNPSPGSRFFLFLEAPSKPRSPLAGGVSSARRQYKSASPRNSQRSHSRGMPDSVGRENNLALATSSRMGRSLPRGRPQIAGPNSIFSSVRCEVPLRRMQPSACGLNPWCRFFEFGRCLDGAARHAPGELLACRLVSHRQGPGRAAADFELELRTPSRRKPNDRERAMPAGRR